MQNPPVAKKIPHDRVIHSERVADDYFWLRDKSNPEVVAYLEAENCHTESIMEHTRELQKTLYGEMVGRIQETDVTALLKFDDFYYYEKTEKGKQYSSHWRKKGSIEAVEELLLDENDLAKNQAYFSLRVFRASPDHSLLAYSVDLDGSETLTLCVKDLNTGELLPDQIPNTYDSVEWASDGRTLCPQLK